MAAELQAPAGAVPAAAAQDQLMTAPAASVTPGKEKQPPTLGSSPLSKRAVRRVNAAFPTNIETLTMQEICTFIAQQNAQNSNDRLWMNSVQTAITDPSVTRDRKSVV